MNTGQNKRRFGKSPLGYAESLTLSAALTAAGYALQATVPEGTSVPPFPANAAIIAATLSLIIYVQHTSGAHPLVRWLSSAASATGAATAFGLQILIMGSIPQDDPALALGLGEVARSWPFALSFIYLMLVLGLTTAKHTLPLRLRNIPFILNHAGLWIALAAGAAGAGDMRRTTIRIEQGETKTIAHIGTYPIRKQFSIQLERFDPAGQTSQIHISEKGTSATSTVAVRVNHPHTVNGCQIYQTGYGQDGSSQLDIVRDPWLPAVYTGIFMLIAGACLLLHRGTFGGLHRDPQRSHRDPQRV